MENAKLCIDCKHFKLVDYYYQNIRHEKIAKCTRESKIEFIYGEKLPPFKDCYAERESALRLENERCGYKGIYWEKK